MPSPKTTTTEIRPRSNSINLNALGYSPLEMEAFRLMGLHLAMLGGFTPTQWSTINGIISSRQIQVPPEVLASNKPGVVTQLRRAV